MQISLLLLIMLFMTVLTFSLSFGPNKPEASYFEDVLSIGAFHAFQRGIVVCGAAGNSILPKTATKLAPWIISVAASTINRELQSSINLENSRTITGYSLNPSDLETAIGLISGSGAALPGVPQTNASFCQANTLNPNMTKGKVVVCNLQNESVDRILMRIYIRSIGGVGMIVVDPVAQDLLFQFGLQATVISPKAAEELQTYIAAEKNPRATIVQTSTFMSTKAAPAMAGFSSKGPNVINPDIIKVPDVTAPGVNILAAWSPVALPSTGTSMSCPRICSGCHFKDLPPFLEPCSYKICTNDNSKPAR